MDNRMTPNKLPPLPAFQSAIWRDWMTTEQADKLGEEIRNWLLSHEALRQSQSLPFDEGSPCLEPRPVGMVYPEKPAPRAWGYLDDSGVEWSAYDTGQMEAYARDAVASYYGVNLGEECDKAADDLRLYGSAFMRDGKRIDPATVYIDRGQSQSLPAGAVDEDRARALSDLDMMNELAGNKGSADYCRVLGQVVEPHLPTIRAALQADAREKGEVYRCDFCGSDYTEASLCCNRRREYLAHFEAREKTEATDEMIEAGCLAAVEVTGFNPKNWPATYPDADQLRKVVRAVLATHPAQASEKTGEKS